MFTSGSYRGFLTNANLNYLIRVRLLKIILLCSVFGTANAQNYWSLLDSITEGMKTGGSEVCYYVVDSSNESINLRFDFMFNHLATKAMVTDILTYPNFNKVKTPHHLQKEAKGRKRRIIKTVLISCVFLFILFLLLCFMCLEKKLLTRVEKR